MVVRRAFLVASGDPAILLELVEQPFHPVPLAIRRLVEARRTPLVLLARNHRPNATPPQRCPHGVAAVPLVADQPQGAQPRSPTTGSFDRSPFRQGRQRLLVVPLPSGQDEDDRLALALGPDVDLGAEAAPRATERFGLWVPPFAPAAC